MTIGDIIVLGINQDEFTVISIANSQLLTLDRPGYGGPGPYLNFQSVLRRPSIYTFFDNSDSIRGHIDNYGNMMIGPSKPTTMLEISGTSNVSTSIPEISITNTTIEDSLYGRKTAINFKGYDAINSILNQTVNLGRIETSHYGTSTDTNGVMKFFVNSGGPSGELNIMTMTSNGNIGIGDQNEPLTLIHALTQDTALECALLLESSYANIPASLSVFDERSDIYFAGIDSITETLNPDIRYRVLSAVSGSKDDNLLNLNGRLDFLVNNDTQIVPNGIESKMCVTHSGNVGVNIMQPANLFNVAPERRLISGEQNTISITASGGTVITLNNNIFSGLTAEQKKMFIGGSVVVENDSLTRANIISINANNQLTVDTNLSAYVGNIIYVHYAGLNVNGSNGFVGINTINPQSVLSVNGSISLPIVKTTLDITLDCTNYTVICDTTGGNITVTLPINSSNLIGRIYVIKKFPYLGPNTCSINPNGSTIDGSGGLLNITSFIQVQSDGTDWWAFGL